MNHRYFLFGGNFGYVFGGWKDFRETFPSIYAATVIANKKDWDWWHVVDLDTFEIVRDFTRTKEEYLSRQEQRA